MDFNLYCDKVLELAYDGIILVDADYRILLANSAARKILAIKQQYIGEYIGDIIPSSRLPIAMKTKISDVNRYQALKDNMVIVYSNYPVFNKKKEVIGGFAVFRDLSGANTVPADMQTLKSLKETQIIMKAILDSTQDAVSVVDENGIGVLVNNAHCKMTGWKEEEVIGKHCTQLDFTEEKSVHMKVLKSKVPLKNQSLHVPQKDKDYIIHGTPIIVDNELKGSVTVIQDITQIKSLSDQLNSAIGKIKQLESRYSFNDIITIDSKLISQIEEAKKLRSYPATMLITGELGTEIDIFARAIHNESNRNYGSFIEINCENINNNELEYQLFGHPSLEKVKSSMELANNGTIYLKNIDSMNIETQGKLLKTLQEKKFCKTSSDCIMETNARVIASTHVNLKELVKIGKFREDLYYRLGIFSIEIPPLSVVDH